MNTNTLLISSDFYSVQGEGFTTGVPSYFIRLGLCNLTSIGVKPGRRVPRVMTPVGKNISINHLKSGDVILAHDEISNSLVETTVQVVYEYKLDKHYEVKIEDTPVLFTSGEHLFLTNEGWKRTDELKQGDEILHYTAQDKQSFKMKSKNPMFNNDSKNKRLQKIDYQSVGRKVSKKRKELFLSGDLLPPLQIIEQRDKDRYKEIIENLSNRMKVNNPMFNSEVVKNSKGAHNLNSTKDGIYHSKTERKFHELCKEIGLPLEYVGNYDYPIKVNNKNIYPDFILPGTNKVYEIYWSGEGHFAKPTSYRENRSKLYKEAGYECIFVDFTEQNKSTLINLIQSEIYAHNGKKVLSIKEITTSKFPSLYKPLTAYDITCHPYNTFIVENLVTHNCGMSRIFANKLTKEQSLADGEIFEGDLHKEGKATWTCDSTSQWLWRGVEKDFQYLINQWKEQGIYEDIKNGTIHLIWTGGEPTMKFHQEAIVNFIKYWEQIDTSIYFNIIVDKSNNVLSRLTLYNEIETNGTVYIMDSLFNLLSQINCSPKLSNSGMSPKQRIVPSAIKRIMEHSNYQFKFVISNEDDIQEMFRDFIEPFNIPIKKVCCMPGMDSQDQFHERTQWVLEMAKKYKFRGLTRLHISAWDKVLNR